MEAQQASPLLEIGGEDRERGQLHAEGVLDDDGEEDGIDLEGYEEYLEHLKSKVAIRPCSARIVRPMSTESPHFFMNNTDTSVPTRPARPVSARPRMRSAPRHSVDDRTLNGSQSRSSGVGVRRKRQGEKLVHARIRAVYNDVGRFSLPMKEMATHSALSSKSKGLQEAELHDEYYRLLDAESELKATCLQEQQKRVKALAHVRRLEEIIAMKDKKIESLLRVKVIGADRSLSTSKSVAQREIAERDRQFHAFTQKLRQKIAQQSQLLSSYEEAMQSLRSGIKSTNLMELEEERSQLYHELRHHQELLNRQHLEWEAHQQKLLAFAEAEASSKLEITRLLQENKVIAHDKRKLEQEVGFLKSRVELLQNNLALEQRKRTYDREFRESVGKHTSSSPTQKEMLAQALEEMKKLMRRETLASIKREKMRPPNVGAVPLRPAALVPPATKSSAPPAAIPSSSGPTPPTRSTLTSPKHYRPSSAASTRSNGTAPRQAATKYPSMQTQASGNSGHSAIPDTPTTAATAPAAFAAHTLIPKQHDSHTGNEEINDHPDCTEASVATYVRPVEHIADSHDAISIEVSSPIVERNNSARTGVVTETKNREQTEQKICLHMSQLSCPEADPGADHQSGDVSCATGEDEHVTDKITDEEMSEMQLQKLAAAESVLRFDIDDEFDSELSADLLDDAQHPMLRSDAGIDGVSSINDTSDIALIEFGAPKQAEIIPSLDSAPPLPAREASGGLSQALDDLYPSDFLDTDAQGSVGGEYDSEDSEEKNQDE